MYINLQIKKYYKFVLKNIFVNIFNRGDKFMVFLKYFILFIIFLIAAWIGNLISKKYRNRVDELKSFKEAFNILEAKIKFTYEPIGDIFEEISNLFLKNKISSVFYGTKKMRFKMRVLK